MRVCVRVVCLLVVICFVACCRLFVVFGFVRRCPSVVVGVDGRSYRYCCVIGVLLFIVHCLPLLLCRMYCLLVVGCWWVVFCWLLLIVVCCCL